MKNPVAESAHPIRLPNRVGPTRWHPWATGKLPQSSRVTDRGTLDARRRAGLDEEMSALADHVIASENDNAEPDPLRFRWIA